MDVYSLLSIVKSYYRPDNYDLHKKLCIASKKYCEFTRDLSIDKYFDAIIEKSKNKVEYKVCGITHRLYGPAKITYHENGRLKCEMYYINDKLHNEYGPAILMYRKNGVIKHESYHIDGKYHRTGKPACTSWHKNGIIAYTKYYVNGIVHHEYGPSEEERWPNGLLSYKTYIANGKLHREDGPARIDYNYDGSINCIRYYINGKLHREDGPAYTFYRDGLPTVAYYIEGNPVKHGAKIEYIVSKVSCKHVSE